MLLSENYNSDIGISKLESIFYLGLSYNDLVKQLGEVKAAEEYGKRKRQSFKPVGVMETILTEIKPDIVITTASPRFEVATILAAKKLGIPSLQLLDSFGDDYPIPSADHIVVMNHSISEKLRTKGVNNSTFHALGQPILDETIEIVHAIDSSALKQELKMPNSKVLLYLPHKNYIFNDDLSVKEERDSEPINNIIFEILDQLAVTLNIQILIRPHPSDHIENYWKYIKDKPFYSFHPEINVYQSIAISDYSLSYCSTVVLQTLVCRKPAFIFNQNPELNYPWPGYSQKPFIFSRNYEELKENLTTYITDDTPQLLNNFFEEGAVQKINALIKKIIAD